MTAPSTAEDKHVTGAASRERMDGAGRAPAEGKGPLVPPIINGRYRVVETLGTGSLGTVYLCEELATSKRVALKVFERAFGRDEEFSARLRQQVRRAAALKESYPQVLAVFECDRTPNGSPYVATEYLQGRTLKEIIRRGGPLEIRRALRLACQVAEGLDAIHKAGFVHMDVRPENVIVTSVGDEEVAKLKGFEVAGLRETVLIGHMTRAGAIPSHPEYATPEQIDGDQVTPRTDIYAFGVLLYEMLSGRAPFSASSADGVLAKHLQETPPALGSFQREIPSVVESRIKQALDKEPEKRQRYVGDVVNEYLCELAVDELLAERARRDGGLIRTLSAAVRSSVARFSAFAPGEEAHRATWKMATTLLVVLACAAAAWMFWPVREPAPPAALPSLPSAAVAPASPPARPAQVDREPPPAAAPVAAEEASETPDTSGVGGPPTVGARAPTSPDLARPREEAVLPRTPTLPSESSLRPPGMSATPQPSQRPSTRVKAPARREEAPMPPVAAPPTSPQQEAPGSQRGAPDPTAIIDWLLGRPPGSP